MQKGKHSQVEETLYLWHKYVKGKRLASVRCIAPGNSLRLLRQIEGSKTN